MSSIFDLKTSPNELESKNGGLSRMEYNQVAATRDVSGANNFSNGQISFKHQVSGTKWWVPSRSYLRLRMSIKSPTGATLLMANNIAPNMNLMANLFQSMEFLVQDKTVSKITDFVAQCDALDTRLNKSQSWLDGVGRSASFWDSQFKLRQVDITSDGNALPTTESVSTFANGGLVGGNLECKVADNGLVTFAVSQAPKPWAVGDILVLNGYRLNVTAVTNDLVIRISPNVRSDELVVTPANYYRIRASPDTDDARNVSTFELIWRPCLSIYKVEHALPCGNYELRLTPHNAQTLAKSCVESLGVDKVAGVDYAVNIVDFYHYVNVVEGPRCDSLTYFMDLEDVACQSELWGTTNSFIQKQFDVSPSTKSLTVAFQDNRTGQDTRFSASRFKSYDATGTIAQELKMDRFSIQYAGVSYPSPDSQTTFVAGTDLTVQRYLESQLYSGRYFSEGACEDIETFHERGQYLFFSVPRSGDDRSTRAQLNCGFSNSNGADLGNMRVLLFSHYKSVARIVVQDSRVVEVQIDQA